MKDSTIKFFISLILLLAFFTPALINFSGARDYSGANLYPASSSFVTVNNSITLQLDNKNPMKIAGLSILEPGIYRIKIDLTAPSGRHTIANVSFIHSVLVHRSIDKKFKFDVSEVQQSIEFTDNFTMRKELVVLYPRETSYYIKVSLIDGTKLEATISLTKDEVTSLNNNISMLFPEIGKKMFSFKADFGVYQLAIKTNGTVNIVVFDQNLQSNPVNINVYNETIVREVLLQNETYYIIVYVNSPNTELNMNITRLDFSIASGVGEYTINVERGKSHWLVLPIEQFRVYSVDLEHNRDGWLVSGDVMFSNEIINDIGNLFKVSWSGEYQKVSLDEIIFFDTPKISYSIDDPKQYHIYYKIKHSSYENGRLEYSYSAGHSYGEHLAISDNYLVIGLRAWNITTVPEYNVSVTIKIGEREIKTLSLGEIKVKVGPNTTEELSIFKYHGTTGKVLNITFIDTPSDKSITSEIPIVISTRLDSYYVALNSRGIYLIMLHDEDIRLNVTVIDYTYGSTTLSEPTVASIKMPTGGEYRIIIKINSSIGMPYSGIMYLRMYFVNSTGNIQSFSYHDAPVGHAIFSDYYITIYELPENGTVLHLRLPEYEENYYLIAMFYSQIPVELSVELESSLINRLQGASQTGLMVGLASGTGVGFIATYLVAIYLKRRSKEV